MGHPKGMVVDVMVPMVVDMMVPTSQSQGAAVKRTIERIKKI